MSPTAGWSCDQVCSAVCLSCSEAEQHAHNAEVSSSNGMQGIMNAMGKSCDSWGMGKSRGTATDIPVMYTEGARKGTCYTSSLDRTASQYNCARKSPKNDQHESVRLCYCSDMASTTASPDSTCTAMDENGPAECKFPFKNPHTGKVHNECTDEGYEGTGIKICATELEADGITMISEKFAACCCPDCPAELATGKIG